MQMRRKKDTWDKTGSRGTRCGLQRDELSCMEHNCVTDGPENTPAGQNRLVRDTLCLAKGRSVSQEGRKCDTDGPENTPAGQNRLVRDTFCLAKAVLSRRRGGKSGAASAKPALRVAFRKQPTNTSMSYEFTCNCDTHLDLDLNLNT